MDFSTRAFRLVAGMEARPQPPTLRLRAPVVLMHGFGLLGAFGRKGHLHEEAMALRARGVLAFAPNVSPYQTIAARAAMWQDHLDAIMDETGQGRLHLVAHSMGGLDARYLVSTLGYHRHVASVTTVSTPHHGASMAELVLETPSLLRSPALGLADWTGAAALDGAASDVMGTLRELTRRFVCEEFNPAVPDHPDVVYRSWAARAGLGTPLAISPVLAVSNALIHAREGVNDGIVGTDSGVWTGFQGVLDADHARQVGLTAGLPRRFKSAAFYASVVERIVADEA